MPGVGRKTANVVMNTAFGAETFAVDTHIFRLGNRTGIAPGKTVGSGELWLGNPARCVRKLGEKEIEQLYYSAKHYVRLKDEYL